MNETERRLAIDTLGGAAMQVRSANIMLGHPDLPHFEGLSEVRLLLAAAVEQLETELGKVAPGLRPVHYVVEGVADENGHVTLEFRLPGADD